MTTHSLAKELLSKPDGLMSASDGEKEYVFESLKRVGTCANNDDKTIQWVFKLKESRGGILKW